MSAPPAVRWLTRWEAEGPLLTAVAGLGLATVVVIAVAAVAMPAGTPDWVTAVAVGLPLAGAAYAVYLVARTHERSRTAALKAVADRLGLGFAETTDRPVLPAEFPLAVWANRQWPARERRPRNVLAGTVGGRAVVVCDQKYRYGKHQVTVTAAYLPDPIPGLPDVPAAASFWSLTGRGAVPAEVKPVLDRFPLLTVEVRGGRVLVYRDRYQVHPDGLADFLALAGRVYAELAAAAG